MKVHKNRHGHQEKIPHFHLDDAGTLEVHELKQVLVAAVHDQVMENLVRWGLGTEKEHALGTLYEDL